MDSRSSGRIGSEPNRVRARQPAAQTNRTDPAGQTQPRTRRVADAEPPSSPPGRAEHAPPPTRTQQDSPPTSSLQSGCRRLDDSDDAVAERRPAAQPSFGTLAQVSGGPA